MNNCDRKFKVFWVGCIGYQYTSKEDLLESIKHCVELDCRDYFDFELKEKWFRPYTKDEALDLLEKINYDSKYYFFKSTLLGIDLYALIQYYSIYGYKSLTIFDYLFDNN